MKFRNLGVLPCMFIVALTACKGGGDGGDTEGADSNSEEEGEEGESSADGSSADGSSGTVSSGSGSGSASGSGTASEGTVTESSDSASSTDDETSSDSASETASEGGTLTSDGTADSGTMSDSSAGDGTETDGTGECKIRMCEGKLYECGDCIDNELVGDGLVDGADPECISPCDDDENSFQTGVPGDNADPCKQDCFFDGNSGGGGVDCEWNLKCDPLSPGEELNCPYDPDFTMCPDPTDCTDTCPVPNGCDCFGCCTVVVGGTEYDVYLGDPNCSIANIATCQSCTPSTSCGNDCGKCETCIGQPPPPPDCDPTDTDSDTSTDSDSTTGGGGECPNEQEPCTVNPNGSDNCPITHYCQTGCCVPIPQ